MINSVDLIIESIINDNNFLNSLIITYNSRNEVYVRLEIVVKKIFDKLKINNKYQYKFDQYTFDFLINDNIVFEIDGSSHRSVKSKLHDYKRDQYCYNNKLYVYRIQNNKIHSLFIKSYKNAPSIKTTINKEKLKDFIIEIFRLINNTDLSCKINRKMFINSIKYEIKAKEKKIKTTL